MPREKQTTYEGMTLEWMNEKDANVTDTKLKEVCKIK
jgi:hypothetical protein